jgi:prepilin-type N-terminal cleavage/methylation domain-containing protein
MKHNKDHNQSTFPTKPETRIPNPHLANPQSPVPNPYSGFTLIELIMVVVVLLIIAAFIAPKMTGVTGTRVNAASRKISADIRYAQQLAISTQTNHGVIFNASPTNTYSIYRETTSTIITDSFTGGAYTVQLNTGDYGGVTIDSGYQVEFDSLGSPVTGGGGSVTISNAGSEPIRTITVAANTGKVSIN